MAVDKSNLDFVINCTDTLVEVLLERWKVEGELADAPATQVKHLQAQRDFAVEKYDGAIKEIQDNLQVYCKDDAGMLDAVIKRIGNYAYKSASEKFL